MDCTDVCNAKIFRRQRHPPTVNAISIEVLSLIMHYARGDLGEQPDPQRAYDRNIFLVQLSAVCRHWRFAAVADGTLWCNISFSPSILPTIDCAMSFLERSRGASLTLGIWNSGGSNAIVQVPGLTDLLYALGKDSDRVAALYAVDPPDVVIQAFNRPAMKLRHLGLQTQDSRETPPPFVGIMPQLEYLSISNPTGWEIETFRHLHTVHITAYSWKLWHLSTLLDCLDSNVALRDLHLTCFEFFEPELATPENRVVSFPSLHILRFTFCNTALLLNHFDIPPSTALSIYNYCHHSQDILTCLPESPRFLGALRDPQFLTVVFDVERQIFEVETPGPENVHILLGAIPREGRFGRKWVLRSMAAVTRFAPLSGVKWLTVVIDEYQMPWRMWLARFSQLATLEVRCPDPEEILNALTFSAGGTGRVPCPLLRSLSMERNERPTVNSFVLHKFLSMRASTGNAILRLNLNNLDWSSIENAGRAAWEDLIRHTQLNGRCSCVCASFIFSEATSPVTIGSFKQREDLLL